MAGRLGHAQCLIFGLVLCAGAAASLVCPKPSLCRMGARTPQLAASCGRRTRHKTVRRPGRPSVTPETEPTPARLNSATRTVEATAWTQPASPSSAITRARSTASGASRTWTAYWHFKHDHDLGAYSNLLDAPVQEKLAALCKDQPAEETAWRNPATDPEAYRTQETRSGVGSETRSVRSRGLAAAFARKARSPSRGRATRAATHLDLDCLPEDLDRCLRRAHGSASSAKAATGLRAAAERARSGPARRVCRATMGWCGAAPACRSTGILRSTTCGASSERAMSSFARRRRDNCPAPGSGNGKW